MLRAKGHEVSGGTTPATAQNMGGLLLRVGVDDGDARADDAVTTTIEGLRVASGVLCDDCQAMAMRAYRRRGQHERAPREATCGSPSGEPRPTSATTLGREPPGQAVGVRGGGVHEMDGGERRGVFTLQEEDPHARSYGAKKVNRAVGNMTDREAGAGRSAPSTAFMPNFRCFRF